MAIHKGVTRWLAAGAFATAATVVLAACAGGGTADTINGIGPSELTEPESPITITYAGAAYAADQIQPVIDAFEAAHPNISVE
jgi:multiple sugar transport system substrate-binding protein